MFSKKFLTKSKNTNRFLLFLLGLQRLDETVDLLLRHVLHHNHMRQLSTKTLVVAQRQIVLAA